MPGMSTDPSRENEHAGYSVKCLVVSNLWNTIGECNRMLKHEDLIQLRINQGGGLMPKGKTGKV